jgi:hypothetical protein
MFAARSAFGALLLILILHAAAAAQLTTGDIVGRVADESGGILPGATITVQNVGTGDVRTTVTTDTGDYLITLLPIGNYLVRIELQGFSIQESKVAVRSGEQIRVDGRLRVGSVTETVEVTAEAPLLQTESATISTLVTESEVQDLPVNGRNFISLIQGVPGANTGAPNALGSGTRPDDRRPTASVSINGAGDNRNNMLIDGMDNNERAIGTIVVRPSIDAIAEVRVQTSNYPAEVGRTAGGVVNILTKAGTNTLHGTLYGFWRDDRFDSRDYFATVDPLLKQKQFGGSIGGPLVRDRTFYFADYEGFRNRQGQVNVLTVPTARMRRGDFSEVAQVIYDPVTRQPFGGNVIPPGRIDPIAARFMDLYPEPTSPGLANNYSSTTLRTQNSTTADARIDHRFSDNNSVWGRFSINDSRTVTPPGCPPVNGIHGNCLTGANAGFPGPNDTDAKALQVNYVRIFNPTMIGEFKAGYMNVGIFSYPSNYQTNVSEQFGLRGVNIDDLASGLALQNIVGYALLGDTQNIPLINQNWTQQYNASVTKTTGSHNIKVGGGVILREFSVQQSQQPNGLWTYNNLVTRNAAGAGGHAMASFLLGLPSQVQRSHTPMEPFYHVQEPSVYVQDDWRATSWLTVNLGLRYDVFTPFTEEQDRLSNLDLDAPRVLLAGRDGVSRTAGVSTDRGNIGPRFGFAATLPRTSVLRGGYGLTYFPSTIASFAYMKNTPLFSIYGPVISDATLLGGLPTVFLRDGLPPQPAAPPIAPNLLSGAFRAVDLDIKATRVHQFNLQFEKEFSGNVATVGYIGSRSDRSGMNPDINVAPPGAGAVQARRRYASVLPSVTTLNLYASMWETYYDAFQATFQRRLSGGLSFNTHYRLANAEWTDFVPWDGLVEEREAAPRDMRHMWGGQVNYALPWGESLTGFAHGLLAGWQINAVAGIQTGEPFDITNAAARANTGLNDRPNMVGDPELPGDQQTVQRWINTDAFVAQPVNTLGDAPPSPLHGPLTKRLALSFFKELAVTGPVRVQLRYEIYNLGNAANFINPVATFGTADFGSINSTGNFQPQQMQFAVKLIF